VWYEENSIWEHLTLRKLETTDILSSPMLMTLARAAQSESASAFIFESGLLAQLNASILRKTWLRFFSSIMSSESGNILQLEFWNYNHAVLMNGLQLTEEITCEYKIKHGICIYAIENMKRLLSCFLRLYYNTATNCHSGILRRALFIESIQGLVWDGRLNLLASNPSSPVHCSVQSEGILLWVPPI